ncbi:MAG: ABC transporter permease [Desulfurococcales archaeon]|nr:ABC transporter permease [Desulfurococcales archaeon]
MPKIKIPKIFGRKKEEKRELTSFEILLKTWSGKISVVMIGIMILIAIFAVAYYTPQGMKDYEMKKSLFTYLYPENVPPCWVVSKAPSIMITTDNFDKKIVASDNINIVSDDSIDPNTKEAIQEYINAVKKYGVNLVVVNATYEKIINYETEKGAIPVDTAIAAVFHIGEKANIGGRATMIYVNIYVERPDGLRIHIFKGKIVPIPGTREYKLFGDYDKDVEFLHKKYDTFYKPVSLNSLVGSNVSSTEGAQYFSKEIINKSKIIFKDNTKLADKFTKKPGSMIYVTLENNKPSGLSGPYKIHFEIDYVVPGNLVLTNGQFDAAKARKNNASIDPIALVYQIKGNCYGFFGTDTFGRPIGMGLLFGLPYAFLLGFIVTFTSTFIGAFYGSAAGYWKDIRGEAMMRVVDIVNSLPFLPILIALNVALGTINLWLLALLMIALFWSGPVIVVRSMALQISEQIYVEAAKAIGASTRRILFKHVFPQVFPYTMAIAVLSMPGIIIAEASLAVLGLGDPVAPTWGKLLNEAYQQNAVINGYWWLYLFPGLALVVFSAAFLILGRALEPIVAPKLIK